MANAPHLPVHLGAMAHAVKFQIENCVDWEEGEVILANHPGGIFNCSPSLTRLKLEAATYLTSLSSPPSIALQTKKKPL